MKITANELRIGNWVFDTVTKTFGQITSISQKDNGIYEGIKIDPEILLKAGFEFSEDGTFAYQQDYLYIDIIRGKYVYMHPYHPLKLKYLHQLQNLYYALTSHELTINL